MNSVYCVEDPSIRKGIAYFKCGTDGVLHRENGPARWWELYNGCTAAMYYFDGVPHREDGPAYCYDGYDKNHPNQVVTATRLRQISNYIHAEKKETPLYQEWWWHGEKLSVVEWMDCQSQSKKG
ncbi:MAG: hypothetical protein KAJ19_26780, partial [Gammaproteobacteria bacterium]|nr:hypothetical protein [Gammaproteobacteria bacterium]